MTTIRRWIAVTLSVALLRRLQAVSFDGSCDPGSCLDSNQCCDDTELSRKTSKRIYSTSEFVNLDKLDVNYETYPFPHVIIDNFFNEDKIEETLQHINSMSDDDAATKFLNPNNPYEYNKFGFRGNLPSFLNRIFAEFASSEFVEKLETLTGIDDLIKEQSDLRGAGIHRIRKGGYLQLHTDCNTYTDDGVIMDRRINLFLYLNPDWKEEYRGELCMCDSETRKCVKKVLPVLNRCVIFSTTNKSIHGHPVPLATPEGVCRQSIAMYYYTKNTQSGDTDFEGDHHHTTLWHSDIDVDA
jgi:Rps23 Pro-64 3,4-dihydroxylase Tpa1-like proline 4-hydroxylase